MVFHKSVFEIVFSTDMPHTHPVLIAEDDEDIVFFLEWSFRKAGIQNPVKVVRDGEEAIEYLEGNGTHKTPRLAASTF